MWVWGVAQSLQCVVSSISCARRPRGVVTISRSSRSFPFVYPLALPSALHFIQWCQCASHFYWPLLYPSVSVQFYPYASDPARKRRWAVSIRALLYNRPPPKSPALAVSIHISPNAAVHIPGLSGHSAAIMPMTKKHPHYSATTTIADILN